MTKKHLLKIALLILSLSPSPAHAAIVYSLGSSSPLMTNGSIVATSGAAASTYNGTWLDSSTGAAGTWSFNIAVNTSATGGTVVWQGNAGSSVNIGNTNGRGLLIDIRALNSSGGISVPNIVDGLTMSFTMTATSSLTTLGNLAYSVGPSGNGSHSDWGDAVLNTGGTYNPGSAGSNNYNPLTGVIDPTITTSTNAQNWYIDWNNTTTTLTYVGDINHRDTHVFGISSFEKIPEPSTFTLLGLCSFYLLLKRKR